MSEPIFRVYILESPSEKDLFDERREGVALSEAMHLADIPHNYFLVESESELAEAMKLIGVSVSEARTEADRLVLPYLHVSAHGNDEGIGLTNGDFLEWNQLWKHLHLLNNYIRYWPTVDDNGNLDLNVKPHSTLTLCMSTCDGFKGIQLSRDVPLSPFAALHGPGEAVTWTDSLVAWITFYHQMLTKHGVSAEEATSLMNAAAGLDDVFEWFVAPEVIESSRKRTEYEDLRTRSTRASG